MKRFLSFVLAMGMTLIVWSQTYNGGTGTISANNTTYFNLNIDGINPNSINSTFGLEWVKLSLNCSDTHNISVILVAPDNTEVILLHAITWGTTYNNTYFKDNAYYFLNEGSGNYNGTFRPDENLGMINNGQNPNGLWKLKIVNKNASIGTLSNWSVFFSNSPSIPVAFTTTNLPIVSINTNGQLIYDEPKITAQMIIIDNPSGVNQLSDTPTFSSNIGIEFRGQSSQGVVKKSYGITTKDALGQDVNVSIFDMPAEEDWVLIANYNDKSLMRNALAYELARQTGRYASRTQFCEVFINNQYRGVYHFGEKIKRDNNRVDIAKLEPNENTGDDLTGGYIIKIDKTNGWEPLFTSPFPPTNHPNGQTISYLYEYPDGEVISTQQQNYIQSYVVNNFENSLNSSNFTDPTTGYRPYIDEESFMDYFFINEISKNVDGYRISTYLHKDKNGELVMGPVWDFDLAFRNADYCNGNYYTGWAFQFPCNNDNWQPPFWWEKLFQDDNYCHDMHEKWVQFRQTIFSNTAINNIVEFMANELNIAQSRNFQKWNTMGRYIWPNPTPLATTYEQEISNMKTWIQNRLDWLDINMPNPIVSSIREEKINNIFKIVPNPIDDNILNIKWLNNYSTIFISIYNTNGNEVYQTKCSNTIDSVFTINLNNLSSGIYSLRVVNNEFSTIEKIIIK